MATKAMKYCPKCSRSMDEGNFYQYRNGEKTELCKKCLTMHIDNFDPSTFLWLLEDMDVPYMKGEWDSLLERAYAKDPDGLNGMSVFGKYIGKMKLNQYKNLRWADTERLAREREKKEAAAMKNYEEQSAKLKEQLDQGEISEAQYRTLLKAQDQEGQRMVASLAPPPQQFQESQFLSEDEIPDPGAMLTQEDKLKLAIKWGRLYKPAEWVELEKNYDEMMDSFDIRDADTMNTLVLLCKTNLKMNQAIDSGDFEGYQKLSRVYDAMRKSAKFTAAQNKDSKGEFANSIGQLIDICERDGFIPRYATDIPQDKVDMTLQDMNNYLRKLVTQDLGFGQQIEDSIKKIQLQKEMNDEAVPLEDDNVFEIDDPDIQEYYATIEAQKEEDSNLFNGGDDEWPQLI